MNEHQCKNERAIADNDQGIKDLREKVDKLYNRMFVNNGQPSFQTLLDRQQRMLNVFMWLITVTSSAVIGMAVRAIFTAVNK